MSSKKNRTVILLTIDALRPDHLFSHGYKRKTDTFLSHFIKKGVKFNNAFTNGPATPSSFSAIFSSILPFLDGGYSPLPPSKITFPQILKEYGIFTMGIHSNPNLTKFYNYNKCFDIFLDGLKYQIKEEKKINNLDLMQIMSNILNKIFNIKKLTEYFLYKLRGFNKIKHIIRKRFPIITNVILPITNAAFNAPYLAEKINSYLKKESGPSFLWAHFMDIHSPYNPPPKNVKQFRDKDFSLIERNELINEVYGNTGKYQITQNLIDKLEILYDAQINYLDEYLGKILSFINQNFEKDCLIIITADHGESFYEHGFFGHQGNLFNELLKVPFIIIEKKGIQKKKIIKTPVQLIDIAPTILDYFNIPIPDYFQGKSLIPLLKGENAKFPKNRVIISEGYQKNRRVKRNHKDGYILLSIIRGIWKYIFDEELNKEYLFNLNKDPKEEHNLITEKEEIIKDFRFIKEQHLKRVKDSNEKVKISRVIKNIKI